MCHKLLHCIQKIRHFTILILMCNALMCRRDYNTPTNDQTILTSN